MASARSAAVLAVFCGAELGSASAGCHSPSGASEHFRGQVWGEIVHAAPKSFLSQSWIGYLELPSLVADWDVCFFHLFFRGRQSSGRFVLSVFRLRICVCRTVATKRTNVAGSGIAAARASGEEVVRGIDGPFIVNSSSPQEFPSMRPW